MTNLPFILSRMELKLAESGTAVALRWIEYSGGFADPATGANISGVAMNMSGVLNGFIYDVLPKQIVRSFQEIEAGDLILEVLPDAPIDGKIGLRFIVGGQQYVQKDVGSKLSTAWDAIVQGQKLFRVLLLRKDT